MTLARNPERRLTGQGKRDATRGPERVLRIVPRVRCASHTPRTPARKAARPRPRPGGREAGRPPAQTGRRRHRGRVRRRAELGVRRRRETFSEPHGSLGTRLLRSRLKTEAEESANGKRARRGTRGQTEGGKRTRTPGRERNRVGGGRTRGGNRAQGAARAREAGSPGPRHGAGAEGQRLPLAVPRVLGL